MKKQFRSILTRFTIEKNSLQRAPFNCHMLFPFFLFYLAISFAHRLDENDVEVRMRIFSSMPHKFLGFYPISSACRDAVKLIGAWIGIGFRQEV